MSQQAHHLREALVQRVLHGDGRASSAARQAAFDARPHDARVDALVTRVATHAWTVQDADVASVLGDGVGEDELFELVVCAAIGQATRQMTSGLAALDAATASVGAPSPPAGSMTQEAAR